MDSSETLTLLCRACGETKPASDFYRNVRERNGYCSKCKICMELGKPLRPDLKIRPGLSDRDRAFIAAHYHELGITGCRKVLGANYATVASYAFNRDLKCSWTGNITGALRVRIEDLRRWWLAGAPVDENGCYTLPNGECLGVGPCPHTDQA